MPTRNSKLLHRRRYRADRSSRRLRLPEQRYAIFTHRGHISHIRATTYTIWNKWLPESGRKLAKAPDFERYDDRFDPKTATGEVEIWLPIAD